MVTPINYREMLGWVSASLITEIAEAFRQDAAAFERATADIGPAWSDLRGVFDVPHEFLYDSFYQAGADVSAFGEAVKTGGDNIAKYLDECAQIVQKLEGRRTGLIERADQSNNWWAGRSEPIYVGPECSATTPEEQEAYDKRDEHDEIAEEVDDACKEYVEAMEEAAKKIRDLDDDGTTHNPWGGWIVTGLVITGSAVGVFIAPVGYAATGLAIARAYYDEYQDRRRELLEEHPEMFDHEITQQSLRSSVINGTPSALESLILHLAGSDVTKALTANRALTQAAAQRLEVAINLATNGSSEANRYLSEDEDGNPRPLIGPPDRVWDPTYAEPSPFTAELQQEADAARQTMRTKDYDGDGLTDDSYLPGSSEVNRGLVETAEDVRRYAKAGRPLKSDKVGSS